MLSERPGWAQLVKRPTLDFGFSHDFMVCGFGLLMRLYPDSAEPAWDSLSLSLSAPPLLILSLSLSLSKKKKTLKNQIYHLN